MPGMPVISGETLAAGIRSDFNDIYRQTIEGLAARLGQIVDLGVTSDKLTELYAYYETAPYPQRWQRGEKIPSSAFKGVSFNITNFDWARRIEWHENDRQDDQTRSLFDQARSLGQHFATLPERITYQILQDQTDSLLLPKVPLAADGAALYAATAGGTDRFGLSGGNVQGGSGVASGQAIREDFFNAVERFAQFQDTESQPLWDQGDIDQGFVITFNVANWHVFAEAFLQARTVGGVGQAAAAAPTNVVLDTGVKVQLWPTQRITDNDSYVFMTGSPRKAIIQQVRSPLRDAFATMETSDQVRDTKIEYVQWDSREGYGIPIPYQTVKINN